MYELLSLLAVKPLLENNYFNLFVWLFTLRPEVYHSLCKRNIQVALLYHFKETHYLIGKFNI